MFQDQSELFLGSFKLHAGERFQSARHSGQTESWVWDLLRALTLSFGATPDAETTNLDQSGIGCKIS